MEITFKNLKNGAVSLEFGNKDQIQAIDREASDKEREEKQGEYEVEIRYSGSWLTTVKAWDKDEAEEIARDNFSDDGDCYGDAEIDDVEITCIKEPTEEDKIDSPG